LIGDGLGWKLDKITETIEPIIYRKTVKSSYLTVKPGLAAGVKQVGPRMERAGKIDQPQFEASIGAGTSYDSVSISGTSPMEVIIKGGTMGISLR